jgi:hypothetical protein
MSGENVVAATFSRSSASPTFLMLLNVPLPYDRRWKTAPNGRFPMMGSFFSVAIILSSLLRS